MVDFQYRAAMDTYEQMNGRIRVEHLYPDIEAQLDKPGLLRRMWQALSAGRTGQDQRLHGKTIGKDAAVPGQA